MLGLTFLSKLDWGSYIISIAKAAPKKIGALIYSLKFLSHELALYIYKSTIHPCIEYEKCSQLNSSKCSQLNSSLGIALVDVLLNWLNWFHFLFLEGDLLVILIDCMIFLSPFLDVTKISMSTISLLTQLDSEILFL